MCHVPHSDKCSAMARPIPEAAPGTKARFPARFTVLFGAVITGKEDVEVKEVEEVEEVEAATAVLRASRIVEGDAPR